MVLKKFNAHFFILSIILLTLASSLLASEIPADKDIIVFSSKYGNVTFNHSLHASLKNVGGLVNVECNTCHHTYEKEMTIKPCGDCHVKSKKVDLNSPPNLKKAFHYRCRGCHKYTMEQGKNAGPDKKCRLCHKK